MEHGAGYTYAGDSRGIDMPNQPSTVPAPGIQRCRDPRTAQTRGPTRKSASPEPVCSAMLDARDPRPHWHVAGRPQRNLLPADGHVALVFQRISEPCVPPNENEVYY